MKLVPKLREIKQLKVVKLNQGRSDSRTLLSIRLGMERKVLGQC